MLCYLKVVEFTRMRYQCIDQAVRYHPSRHRGCCKLMYLVRLATHVGSYPAQKPTQRRLIDLDTRIFESLAGPLGQLFVIETSKLKSRSFVAKKLAHLPNPIELVGYKDNDRRRGWIGQIG